MRGFNQEECERIIGYTFKNKELLKTCFTHASYAYEKGVKNNERLEFFGDSITVAGLLTARDIENQLKDKELGEALLVPSNALRADGAVFLDDVTPDELGKKLSVTVVPTQSEASDFIRCALGLN